MTILWELAVSDFRKNVGNFVFSIFQNLISFGTIHKCGETHSTLMGGDMASFNEVTGLPKVQKLKALKDSGLFAKVRKSCQTSSFLIFFFSTMSLLPAMIPFTFSTFT